MPHGAIRDLVTFCRYQGTGIVAGQKKGTDPTESAPQISSLRREQCLTVFVDYSRDIAGQIEIEALLDAVHLGAMDSEICSPNTTSRPEHKATSIINVPVKPGILSCMSRYTCFQVAAMEQKSMLSECVTSLVSSHCYPGWSASVSKSMIIHRESYRKRVIA